MAVCLETDTAEGVHGTGVGIVMGVLSCSSITELVVFEGVDNGFLLLGRVFCGSSLYFGLVESSNIFVRLAFVGIAADMGEKGFRIIGDLGSQALAGSNVCFFTGKPAPSNPLLPRKAHKHGHCKGQVKNSSMGEYTTG